MQELSLHDRRGRYLRTTICRVCGLVWSNPRPSEEDVRRYYSREYRVEYKGRSAPSLRRVARSGRGAINRYRDIQPFLRRGDAMLDVGAGGGELVYVLRRRGLAAQGLEPDERYAAYAREVLRVPVETGFIQDRSFAPDSFGFITMYHTLEHLEDPSGALSRLRQWLAPGRLLLVEVPNVEAVCQAPRSRFHPAHFYSFNGLTLEALGRNVGLVPVHTEISKDGGNLTCVFRKSETRLDVTALPGNYARIAGIIRAHRTLSYYLSAVPYVRAWGRMRAYLSDHAAAKLGANAREVLDALLAASPLRSVDA